MGAPEQKSLLSVSAAACWRNGDRLTLAVTVKFIFIFRSHVGKVWRFDKTILRAFQLGAVLRIDACKCSSVQMMVESVRTLRVRRSLRTLHELPLEALVPRVQRSHQQSADFERFLQGHGSAALALRLAHRLGSK
jgi:hypothetical protein